MIGLWFLAVGSPAFAYSPRYAAGYSAQSGLLTRVFEAIAKMKINNR